MSWIVGTLAGFEDSPVIINVESISMVAGSTEGGCAVFFSEPESRISLRENYADIYAQIANIKNLEGHPDAALFQSKAPKQSP